MRQILAAAGQPLPMGPPVLEINPSHALLSRLEGEEDETRFADLAWVILDQACLAEGSELEEPAEFVARVNRLLTGDA
jgi:molecular chaperone HtpG